MRRQQLTHILTHTHTHTHTHAHTHRHTHTGEPTELNREARASPRGQQTTGEAIQRRYRCIQRKHRSDCRLSVASRMPLDCLCSLYGSGLPLCYLYSPIRLCIASVLPLCRLCIASGLPLVASVCLGIASLFPLYFLSISSIASVCLCIASDCLSVASRLPRDCLCGAVLPLRCLSCIASRLPPSASGLPIASLFPLYSLPLLPLYCPC
jgi:hypothetical protein